MAIRETGRTTGPLHTGKLNAPAAPGPLARAAGTGKLAPKGPHENEKAHAERLQAIAGKTHLGALPWEAGGAAIAGTAYEVAKTTRSVQKKVQDVRETVSKLRGAGAAIARKVPSGPKLAGLAKFDAGVRIVGGVNSAVKLAHTVRSLKDGVTVDKVNSLAKETVGVIRGADGAVKMWKKGADIAKLAAGSGSKVARFVGGKLNPVLAVTSAATTLVESRKNIQNWKKISTAQKIKTVADTVGAVADVVGVVFPPAKAVSAGLALVSMGVDWFSKK